MDFYDFAKFLTVEGEKAVVLVKNVNLKVAPQTFPSGCKLRFQFNGGITKGSSKPLVTFVIYKSMHSV